MEDPRIVINAKVYAEVTGAKGVTQLASACQIAAEEAGTVIGLAPPQLELSMIGQLCLDRVELYAQHTDALVPGSGTGWITPEAVQAAGAAGTILNHAEHKIAHVDVAATLERVHALGMKSMVCADGMDETRLLATLNPSFLAVEPPELIGGDISVTSADPAIVSDTAAAIAELSRTTKTFCGAGVKTGKDVAAALELGAYGVLLASGVVKAQDPLAAIRDLVSGL
jgi:triosephosphate isomerase